MPIYEYLCEKCGHEFEREQRITEDPVKSCPKCRARKVRRLISRTGFVLKGGGWYSDLYSSSKPGGAAEGDGGESKTEAKPDAKPEAKPEAKSEAKPEAKPSGDTAKPSGSKKSGKKGTKPRAA